MAHDKPVALLTGANKGIGLQIAREPAAERIRSEFGRTNENTVCQQY